MKIILSKKQWNNIGKIDGRIKLAQNLISDPVDENIVDKTKLRDYYEKDETYIEPCNTCVHRTKKVDAIGCPCLDCRHYY